MLLCVIKYEERPLLGDVLNECLVTVNGTDFRVPQKGTATKGNAFASHKYAGKSALRYELGVSILGRDLVWIQGPYPAGTYTGIKIFNKVLCFFLIRGASRGRRGVHLTPRQNQVSPECGESGGEVGNAGEGEGVSRDAERAGKKLRDSLPGLPTRHHVVWRCFPGVRRGDRAHHREW